MNKIQLNQLQKQLNKNNIKVDTIDLVNAINTGHGYIKHTAREDEGNKISIQSTHHANGSITVSYLDFKGGGKGSYTTPAEHRTNRTPTELMRWYSQNTPRPLVHNYLKSKKIDVNESTYGAALHPSSGQLCVPYRIGTNTDVSTICYISPSPKNGKYEKKFLYKHPRKNAHIKIGYITETTTRIIVVEGWANGVHIHRATGDPVYSVACAHDIHGVTSHIYETHKDIPITIFADNDTKDDSENIGLKNATTAMNAFSTMLVVPPPNIDASDVVCNADIVDDGQEALRLLVSSTITEEERQTLIDTYCNNDNTSEPETDTADTTKNVSELNLYKRDTVLKQMKQNEHGTHIIKEIAKHFDVMGTIDPESSEGWGTLINIIHNNKTRTVLVPFGLLARNQNEALARLTEHGLYISEQPTLKRLFIDYLKLIKPKTTYISTDVVGWTPDMQAYIMLNGTIIGDNPKNYVHKDTPQTQPPDTEGLCEIEEWQEHVQTPALAMPAATIAMSMVLGSSLSLPLKRNPTITNIKGRTSIGKSTCLEIAKSITSNPINEQTRTSANTTPNALENTLKGHNHQTLIMDELGTMDNFQHLKKMIHMIEAGVGKARNTTSDRNRKIKTFHTDVLYAGEHSIQGLIESEKQTYTGGIATRVLEIEADAGEGHGALTSLEKGKDAKTIIDTIKKNTRKYHSIAYIKWIEHITKNIESIETRFDTFKEQKTFISDYQKIKKQEIKMNEETGRVYTLYEYQYFIVLEGIKANIIKDPQRKTLEHIINYFDDYIKKQTHTTEKNEVLKRLYRAIEGDESHFIQYLDTPTTQRHKIYGAKRYYTATNNDIRIATKTQVTYTDEYGTPKMKESDTLKNEGYRVCYCFFVYAMEEYIIKGYHANMVLDILTEEGLLITPPTQKTRKSRYDKYTFYKKVTDNQSDVFIVTPREVDTDSPPPAPTSSQEPTPLPPAPTSSQEPKQSQLLLVSPAKKTPLQRLQKAQEQYLLNNNIDLDMFYEEHQKSEMSVIEYYNYIINKKTKDNEEADYAKPETITQDYKIY